MMPSIFVTLIPRDRPRTSRALHRLVGAIIAAVVVPQDLDAKPAASPPGVVVATATVIDFPRTIEAIGTARANESIEIRPQISEAVTAIRFDEGQRVSAGHVIIELEDAESLARLAAARASLTDADAKFRRGRELLASKLIPASDLETLEARREAEQAALAAAQARLADTRIRAPFAGRLGLRRVSVGSLISPSVVITTLDDTDTVKVDFDVPETALGHLEVGLPIVARSAAWPEHEFAGVITALDTRVDPVSRSLTVRSTIPNPNERLRAGMFLTVTIAQEKVRALMIPEQAIMPEGSRQYVLVVDDAKLVERRQVTTGRRRPGQVEIVNGLEAGEQVIVEGTQKGRPGGHVEVVGRIEVTR